MSGVRGVLTEALDGHYSVQVKVEMHDNWHVARHVCKCGDLYSDLTEHLVDQVLSLPGVAVVQLPEPGENGEWHVQDVGTVGVYRGETGVIGHYGVDIRDVGLDLVVTPGEARAFARSILAAADTSEGLR